MIKILFVCHGNICRSAMARFLFQHIAEQNGCTVADGMDEKGDFYLDSAATSREEIGNPMDSRAAAALRQHGIACGRHAARQVAVKDYQEYDLIILMDEENHRGINRIIRKDPENKIHMMLEYASDDSFKDPNGAARDVADPWYTHDFEKTYQDLDAGCRGLFDYCQEFGRNFHLRNYAGKGF